MANDSSEKISEDQQPVVKTQWLWFIGLCCGGALAMFLIAGAVRWLVGIAGLR